MTDPAAIDLEAVKTRYEDAKKIAEKDPWNFSADEDLRAIVTEDHPALIAAVEALQTQLIWGFYEEEAPEYTQGSEKLHELHHLVTAEECNGLVKTINELRVTTIELAEHLDKTITVAADAANRMNTAEADATCLREVLEKVKQACLFGDDDAGQIGVTTDPHIPSELFFEICANLKPPQAPVG